MPASLRRGWCRPKAYAATSDLPWMWRNRNGTRIEAHVLPATGELLLGYDY